MTETRRAARPSVSLQINLAPTDHPHARHILPHQLARLAPAVDEVVLTLDLHRSPGRFSEAWLERRPRMDALLTAMCERYSHARVVEVDYGAEAVERVARRFFGARTLPLKDSRGGPYYSYFFGLDTVTHDHVFHLDADMMLSGDAAGWLDAACARLADEPSLLCVAPHPGPPGGQGDAPALGAVADATLPGAWRYRRFSTRIFLVDRAKFERLACPLRPRRPRPVHALRALLAGHPLQREPEAVLTQVMKRRGLSRLDFLGPGFWSLHPPYRSPEFYAALPELLRRVEADDLPDGQRGDEDVNDAMVDWTSARRLKAAKRWWQAR